jgi:methionine synthase II (cobalamin-independent)
MTVVDDVGSFPLPEWISRGEFNKLYLKVRKEMGLDSVAKEGDYKILRGVILESFEKKLDSGLDVVTYPQHYDMHSQFLEPIEQNQREPFLIDETASKSGLRHASQGPSNSISEQNSAQTSTKTC